MASVPKAGISALRQDLYRRMDKQSLAPLWEVLHDAGFVRIAFYSLANKIYFLDDESLDAVRPGGSAGRRTAARRRMRAGLAGPLGDRVVIDMAPAPAPARAGAGLTLADERVRDDLNSGDLVAVLEKFSTPFPGFYLYYPQRRHASPALRALVDHLRGVRGRAKASKKRPKKRR